MVARAIFTRNLEKNQQPLYELAYIVFPIFVDTAQFFKYQSYTRHLAFRESCLA